jgi:hypothetical protein
MKLQPSESLALVGDRSLMTFVPLWRTIDGLLVHVKRGIRGERAPAGAASGRVPCRYAADPGLYPTDMTGGCPIGGYVECVLVEGASEKARTLVVRGEEDGLLEPQKVLVVDELELV